MSPTVAHINGYQPAPFADFSGGLNLRDKSDAVGDREAIDLLNVTFTERGAIRQRDGYTDLTLTDLPARVDSLTAHYTAAGLRQLIVGATDRLLAVDEGGTVLGSLVTSAPGPWAFAQFGDPTRELVYAGNGGDPLSRWDGAAWVAGTALANVDGVAARALPRAGAIAVTASTPGDTSGTNASNRLIATGFGTQVAAGPGGAQSTPSRVFFSNPGAPETWETDGILVPGSSGVEPYQRGRNYIDLTPGDGEAIIAAVTWRELVFIFKQTKFFVLWGESIGSDATPTFHVREVVNAIGLASAQAVAVGRDGVYFMNRRGVYLTNGGDPVLLSDVITPMWTQDPDLYFRSLPINLGALGRVRMLWHMERLYLAVPTGSSSVNDRVLVYDTQHQWWSLYDFPAAALASFRAGSIPGVHFGYSSGPTRIGRQDLGSSLDRGQPITSRWRSGFGDYESSQVKSIRETKLWGSGGVHVSFSIDFNVTQRARLEALFSSSSDWPGVPSEPSPTLLTVITDGTWGDWLSSQQGVWPGAGQISDRLVRYACRGTVFSTEFSNHEMAQTWSVHRVVRHLREIREPSIL